MTIMLTAPPPPAPSAPPAPPAVAPATPVPGRAWIEAMTAAGHPPPRIDWAHEAAIDAAAERAYWREHDGERDEHREWAGEEFFGRGDY